MKDEEISKSCTMAQSTAIHTGTTPSLSPQKQAQYTERP